MKCRHRTTEAGAGAEADRLNQILFISAQSPGCSSKSLGRLLAPDGRARRTGMGLVSCSWPALGRAINIPTKSRLTVGRK